MNKAGVAGDDAGPMALWWQLGGGSMALRCGVSPVAPVHADVRWCGGGSPGESGH